MIDIKTSYFFRYKGLNGVSIARSSPRWFKNGRYPKLFPSWDIVSRYKSGEIDELEYTRIYHKEVLYTLDIDRVVYDLNNKVLLCWEKSGKFCHRRLVANWIERKFGIEILEI